MYMDTNPPEEVPQDDLQTSQQIPLPKNISDLSMIDPTYFIKHIKPNILAQQLTRVEFDLWKSIQPYELLNKSWCRNDLKYRSENVRQLIDRFNSVALWVASSILWSDKVKERITMLTRFIKISKELWDLGNYSTCISMIAGINNSSIRRLKNTFGGITTKMAEELEFLDNQLSQLNNFQTLRDIIHNRTPPMIPYLGIYLKDLTFIEDGNKDKLDGLINFRKMELIYNVISEIKQNQGTDYDIKPHPEILSLLQEVPYNSENELISLSYRREAKNKI